MKKKKILITIILCVILLAGIAGCIFFKTFFAENVLNREHVVVVPPGADFEQVMDTLRKHEVLKSEASFKKTAEVLKYKTIRIGKYDISACRTNLDLVRLLRRGQHYPVKFTFNNLRTVDQLVERVGHKFFFEPEELSALLHDGSYLQKFGLSDTTAVCLFIPNTYELYYDITAEDFLERMSGYYDQFWNNQRLRFADTIGLTPVQVATLASIVEEENMRPSEKAIIAGLYINRLNKGMLLQSDPTVKFAIGDFARKRILNADLQVDSPYNTYKYKGLPPGPIRIPEASTMDSVLHYRHHNYLYMCAKEDFSGYHNFTASAAEHARNAARYRAALNARNIKR
ncbi:MAG: endolytic transglycosylase MltG [Bacteroidales bacterium]|nr:endolytic transglycosylase MltG [Bacteroidales bacterium]